MTTQKRVLVLFLIFIIVIVTACPALAMSSDSASDNNTIRLGFFEFGGMFEGAQEGAVKSGYCYEYMMEVAVYTGWNYEFCYGSYSELYEMLKNGEIDILPYTNYNEQRRQEVLFSNVVLAKEEYYLAIKSDNKSKDTSIQSLNNKTISTLEGADYNSLLLDYIDENGLNVNIIYYPSLSETWEAVENKEADATVFTSNAYNSNGFQCICSFGEKPTYIAVSKNKLNLLTQLNKATDLIESESPALQGELYAKYFTDNPMYQELTSEEEQWIEAHPVLHVGGFSNNSTDLQIVDGEASGLTVDIINGMIEKLSLNATADYKMYNTIEEMSKALENGEIDVFYPFYPDYSTAQERNLLISKTVRVANMELVYKSNTDYQEALSKIATPTIRLGIYYVLDHFPNCEIVSADSVEDAVKKVENGEALGAIAYNQAIHKEKEKYSDLNSTVLLDGCGTCFAATSENHTLIMVLNRGLNYFTNGEISAMSSKHNITPIVSIGEFLSTHKEISVLLLIIVITLLALIIAVIQAVHLKKRADEASKSKTAFLFNMSHDIRTPMNAISGFIDMADRHKDDASILEESLEKAKTSSDYLLKIINDILDMSRIESGKLVLKEQLNYIEDGHKIILEMFESEAKDKGITFRYDFNIENKYLWFDGDRTLQIITNLLSNAVKYTNPGGEILYSVIESPCEKEGYATFTITVKDTGNGMSPEFLNKIYNAFERDTSAIQKGTQGTGLGMSIVKKLADAMKYKINIQSKPGEGTTVTVIAVNRIATKEEIDQYISNHKEADDNTLVAFSGKKVLLVEDNELNREIATDVLIEKGLCVESVDDGIKAVEILKEKGANYYDFVLMDIQMPNMNGYEATKTIRKMYPNDNLPIIALSANAFTEDKIASFEAGMNAHIAKPINIHELFDTISKLLK